MKSWILPVVNFIFVIYMLMFIRKKKKFGNAESTNAKDLNLTTREELVIRKFENEMDLKFDKLEREFNARLGNRITALNLLVEEADKKLKQVHVEGREKSVVKEEISIKDIPESNPTQTEIYNRVNELFNAGLSPKEIASHLKMLEGEVNLITSLIKKKQDE